MVSELGVDLFLHHLSLYTVNQMGPYIHHHINFICGWEGYTLLGIPCNHIMAIHDSFNATMPFDITCSGLINWPY